MASFLDLLIILPIRRSLLSMITLCDLTNLSKTNAKIYAALHDSRIVSSGGETLPLINLQRSVFFEQQTTPCCEKLDVKPPPICSEPHHVRGNNVQGCIMCSMPVCEGCVIKLSFSKNDERPFANRSRSLCPDCYNLGNTPHNDSLEGSASGRSASILNPEEPVCICTAKSGHLCFRCKTKQKVEFQVNLERCHGKGCSRTKAGGFPPRVCLWCGRRLPNDHDRASTRREYNSRHLLARSLSTYERGTDDDVMEAVKLESLWTSQSPLPKLGHPWIPDSYELQRRRELDEISARRSLRGIAAEDARWARSEALRRPESFRPALPTVRRRTTYSSEPSSAWRDTDSMAPTLVERDSAEGSDPSKYDDCNNNLT